jgi:hypothetical protein
MITEDLADIFAPLDEGNELQQKVNKHISKGVSVGAVSPEGKHTNTPEKMKAAHAKIKTDLEASRKSGHIGGWSGPHKGQYRYGGEHEVSHEGSYLVHAKSADKKHHGNMLGALKKVGNVHKQETILSVRGNRGNASDKNAHWHHLNNSKTKGQKEDKGKLKYNQPLAQDTGRTQMKGSTQSFTSKKEGYSDFNNLIDSVQNYCGTDNLITQKQFEEVYGEAREFFVEKYGQPERSFTSVFSFGQKCRKELTEALNNAGVLVERV